MYQQQCSYVNYGDLVDLLGEKFETEYDAIEEDKRYGTWYVRVRRWCVKNRVTLRKVNRLPSHDPTETAARVKRCLQEVEEAVHADNIRLEQCAHHTFPAIMDWGRGMFLFAQKLRDP